MLPWAWGRKRERGRRAPFGVTVAPVAQGPLPSSLPGQEWQVLVMISILQMEKLRLTLTGMHSLKQG